MKPESNSNVFKYTMFWLIFRYKKSGNKRSHILSGGYVDGNGKVIWSTNTNGKKCKIHLQTHLNGDLSNPAPKLVVFFLLHEVGKKKYRETGHVTIDIAKYALNETSEPHRVSLSLSPPIDNVNSDIAKIKLQIYPTTIKSTKKGIPAQEPQTPEEFRIWQDENDDSSTESGSINDEDIVLGETDFENSMESDTHSSSSAVTPTPIIDSSNQIIGGLDLAEAPRVSPGMHRHSRSVGGEWNPATINWEDIAKKEIQVNEDLRLQLKSRDDNLIKVERQFLLREQDIKEKLGAEIQKAKAETDDLVLELQKRSLRTGVTEKKSKKSDTPRGKDDDLQLLRTKFADLKDRYDQLNESNELNVKQINLLKTQIMKKEKQIDKLTNDKPKSRILMPLNHSTSDEETVTFGYSKDEVNDFLKLILAVEITLSLLILVYNSL